MTDQALLLPQNKLEADGERVDRAGKIIAEDDSRRLVRIRAAEFLAFSVQNNQPSVAQKGQIVDATIVSAPKQRNNREENKQIKEGDVPEDWDSTPSKIRKNNEKPIAHQQSRRFSKNSKLETPAEPQFEILEVAISYLSIVNCH